MISIVICSIDEAKFARAVESYRAALRDEPFEIVRIRNARSIAEGYNRGFAKSTGDVIIFSHDDVVVLTQNLATLLRDRLKHFDVLGIAGTRKLQGSQWILSGPPHVYGQIATPNPAEGTLDVMIWSAAAPCIGDIKALDGVFLCTTRKVVEAVPFDEKTFTGFHLYDIDFTFRAHQAGFKLAVCCDVQLVHDSAGTFDDRFYEQHDAFMTKHGASLDAGVERIFSITSMKTQSLQEVVEAMTPPHWRDQDPPPC